MDLPLICLYSNNTIEQTKTQVLPQIIGDPLTSLFYLCTVGGDIYNLIKKKKLAKISIHLNHSFFFSFFVSFINPSVVNLCDLFWRLYVGLTSTTTKQSKRSESNKWIRNGPNGPHSFYTSMANLVLLHQCMDEPWYVGVQY